jgi:hypothetical protein
MSDLFVLDSNFFIEAHRVNYPLDVAHSFWNKVKQLAFEEKIISIDKVKNELYNKNDLLEDWCRNNLPEDFFKSTSDLLNEYQLVANWAMSQTDRYVQMAINEFLDSDEADAFLITFALTDSKRIKIVTHEVSSPTKKNKIKIPDVCNELGVCHLRTVDLFRELKETF